MIDLNSLVAMAGLRTALTGHRNGPVPDGGREIDPADAKNVTGDGIGTQSQASSAGSRPIGQANADQYPRMPIEIPADMYRIVDGDTISIRPGAYSVAGSGQDRDRAAWKCREPLRIRLRSVGAPEVNRFPDILANPPRDIWGDMTEVEKLARDRAAGRMDMAAIATTALEALCSGRALIVTPTGVDRHGRLLADLHASHEGRPSFSIERSLLDLKLVSIRRGETVPPHFGPLSDRSAIRAAIAERHGFELEPDWMQRPGQAGDGAEASPDWLLPAAVAHNAGREAVPGIDRPFGAGLDLDRTSSDGADMQPDWF